MSSLVPGYMTVSWTVSPPAVGVRATCGVEGRPEKGGRGWVCLHTEGVKRKDLRTYLLTLPSLLLVQADILSQTNVSDRAT